MENGLRKQTELNGTIFSIQYKPTDYLIATQMVKSGISEQDAALIKSHSTLSLFDIYITCQGGNMHPYGYNTLTQQEVNQRQQYYTFGIQNDILIKTASRAFSPVYCRAERGALVNNTLTFECGFENLDINEDWSFTIHDTQLGAGMVKFLIKNKDLKKIPSLKYSSQPQE